VKAAHLCTCTFVELFHAATGVADTPGVGGGGKGMAHEVVLAVLTPVAADTTTTA